ncbi:catalase family protein [soil metagenome]
MLNQVPLAIPYSDAVEEIPDDEAKTTQGLIDTMRSISETTFKDEGRAIRSVHAKAHGILQAELEVLDGLPESLAQGLFAKPGRYAAVMRFSTVPGDLLDDSVSTPRGLAVKIVGVEGERLPGSEGDVTQDFVMTDGKAFGAPDPKVFLANLKLLAATTDKIEGVKKVASAVLQQVQKAIIATTGEPNSTVAQLGGVPETQILGTSFFTGVPLRWGDYVAKVGVTPVSAELTALTDQPIKVNGVPNALRESMIAFFATHGGVWEVRVQLRSDAHEMPIENAAKAWPEDKSSYVTVARLTAQPQTAWSEARSDAVDDHMMFSPWHRLAAHRPLGGVMRVRKAAYEAARAYRAEHNGKTIVEPREVSLPA